MEIKVKFQKLSVDSDEVILKITPAAFDKLLLEQIAQGFITTEELVVYAIGQLKLCDKENALRTLPHAVLNKLIETHKSICEDK